MPNTLVMPLAQQVAGQPPQPQSISGALMAPQPQFTAQPQGLWQMILQALQGAGPMYRGAIDQRQQAGINKADQVLGHMNIENNRHREWLDAFDRERKYNALREQLAGLK